MNLDEVRDGVSIMGSARTEPDDEYYQEAVKLGSLLATRGRVVVTGGGPGIMEAANKGAFEAGGVSVGLNLKLPFEQETNPYQTHSEYFVKFYPRKVALVRYASAFVVFPGGFGTLDELFEVLTLIQTTVINRFPVILVGREFWGPMVRWIEEQLVGYTKIDAEDVSLFDLVDTAEEALEILERKQSDEKSSINLS